MIATSIVWITLFRTTAQLYQQPQLMRTKFPQDFGNSPPSELLQTQQFLTKDRFMYPDAKGSVILNSCWLLLLPCSLVNAGQ